MLVKATGILDLAPPPVAFRPTRDGAARRGLPRRSGQPARRAQSISPYCHFHRDANGNVTRIVREQPDAASGTIRTFVTEQVFDALDRVTDIVEDPDGKALRTHFGYDSSGNRTVRTDAKGQETRTAYNGLGLPAEIRYDAGGRNVRVTQEWDDNGRLKGVTDPNGNRTAYHYNGRDLVKEIVYADGTSKRFGYDLRDFVKHWVDPNGTIVDTTYNVTGLPLVRTIVPGPGVGGTVRETFTYDALLRLATAENSSDPSGAKTAGSFFSLAGLTYDEPGNVVRETLDAMDRAHFEESATFDDAGNRRTLAYATGGRSLAFTPDALNRLKEIRGADVGGAEGLVARYDYVGGVPSKRAYGNGVALDVAFDELKRPVSMTHRDMAGVSLAGFEYAYDAAHNKEFEKRTGLQTLGAVSPGVIPSGGIGDAYNYDGLYQLVGAKLGADDLAAGRSFDSYLHFFKKESYDFDGAGNRRTVARDEAGGPSSLESYNSLTGAYTPDLLNRITSLNATCPLPQ